MEKENDSAGATTGHYDRFLAGIYLWMAGGFDKNCSKNAEFFSLHGIVPQSTGNAIDLGAGCGFQSVPLARAGFRVAAVDRCRQLLNELRYRAAGLPVEALEGDILDFPAWAGRTPELVVCMGDTLTHLPDTGSIRDLLRQCHAELVPGGRLVLAFRNYVDRPEDGIDVIPVRRDADRIFLCRLAYADTHVEVSDILYAKESGCWERTAGTYAKIRIAPDRLAAMLAGAGFGIEFFEAGPGLITAIAQKSSRPPGKI